MQTTQRDLARLKVLIVEDEPLILIDCETILRDIGISDIVGVTTSKDAIEAMETSPSFDVAILDVSLQDTSSLSVADILASRGVKTGFMSGYGLEHLPEGLRKRPYISKPFAPYQFRALLEQLVAEDVADCSCT